ncbi:extracellular solute-binding protein [Deinococcus sp. KSM4-11]|uniref:ABC transporter substrate-binding protein n=1 Tax=Deinococcus sp. KSM4-11 TaxID=2568654 RepID=UPI0010A43830|nr:ABC transporter substrate-binding protein [Deinococcus sp. KSM4-11]THF87377.1 extracellular solute-binding protein [Deinococcus sp. KSM4-11]
MNRTRRVTARTTLALLTLALTAAGTVTAQGTTPKPITFTAFFADPNANWNGMQDEVGKVITAKTGVTLKAEFAVGSPDEKINLIAASGQYPDLISPKGAAGVLVDAGAMLDLTDLINKYAPNIKRVIGNQFDRMRFSNKDRGIYFVPTNDAINQTYFDTDAWFKLQLAALKEQKYPQVKTLADYEKVIATYIKAHPKTADGRPTIGLSLLADDWRFLISVTNPAFWATGGSDDGEWYIDPKTYKATLHFFKPEEREYFRWLNHMNDIGLLDPESFTQKYDQYLAKIASGRVVGVIDAGWEIGDAVNSLKAAGKHDQMYGRFGVTTKPGIKVAYNQPTGFVGGWGIGITKSCKDPIAAIKFLDYLASPEGQVLKNWGVQGKQYVVQGGKRVIPDAVLKQKNGDPATFQRTTGVGNYNISIRYGDGVKDPGGNYYTTTYPEQIIDAYTPSEKAALSAYKAKLWNDLLPKASTFQPKPWGAAWSIQVSQDNPLNEFFNKEQDIARKAIPRMILGKPADFDKAYDAFLAELTAKVGKYADMESALVKDRLTLWNVIK